MPENETWLLRGWEQGLKPSVEGLSWMRESYGANDAEIEIEAIAQRLTTLSGVLFYEATTLEQRRQAMDLFNLGRSLNNTPARHSLGVKHAVWSERKRNGEIQ